MPVPRDGALPGWVTDSQVTVMLAADEYWLPAGVYLDHWTLREGIQAPPAARLLMLPGVVDLAERVR